MTVQEAAIRRARESLSADAVLTNGKWETVYAWLMDVGVEHATSVSSNHSSALGMTAPCRQLLGSPGSSRPKREAGRRTSAGPLTIADQTGPRALQNQFRPRDVSGLDAPHDELGRGPIAPEERRCTLVHRRTLLFGRRMGRPHRPAVQVEVCQAPLGSDDRDRVIALASDDALVARRRLSRGAAQPHRHGTRPINRSGEMWLKVWQITPTDRVPMVERIARILTPGQGMACSCGHDTSGIGSDEGADTGRMLRRSRQHFHG